LPAGQSYILSALNNERSLVLIDLSEEEQPSPATDKGSVKSGLNLRLHHGEVEDIALSPDGLWLITMFNGDLSCYKVITKELAFKLNTPPGLNVAVSRDSKLILLGLANGGHQLIDIATGKVIRDYCGPSATSYRLQNCFGGVSDDLVLTPEEGK
jgi:hypothetical protein